MLTQDPFNIGRDVNYFRAEVQKHLRTTDEINKSVSIFRQISLCNTILSHNPNLNHSSYIKGFIYDTLGNDSNLLIVFYVQIMPDDFVMQL
ncbi:hypothetical protein ACU0NY_004408, partial [Escherichia coli]